MLLQEFKESDILIPHAIQNRSRHGIAFVVMLALVTACGCTAQDADEYRVLTEESLPDADAETAPQPEAGGTTSDAVETDDPSTIGQESPAETTTDNSTQAVAETNTSNKAASETAAASTLDQKSKSPQMTAADTEAGAQVPQEQRESASAATKNSSQDAVAAEIARQKARMQAALNGGGDFSSLPAEPLEPREIKLLVPEKEFTVEGPEKAVRVTFDDIDLLKVLNMEPVPTNVMDYLPDWLKQLDGQRIILRGWMFPAGRQTGISRFMFVRDNGICCFGRRPKVYDKLGVTMRDGKTTNYIQGRPFDVVGTFKIEPDVQDGEVFWLYFLEDALVIDE